MSLSFREALFAGLAPDGGLFHPVEKPDLGGLFSRFDDATGFPELASEMTAALLGPEVPQESARRMAARAFTFSPVLRRLDESLLLLELFHGPTCAFKDFGAQFLAAAMEELIGAEDRRMQMLVATSGDTGSAVAHAFHGRRNIDVVILYPSGRVSELQEKQLTTLGGNVHALEVAGSFDDCQRLVKEAFQDPTLRARLRLTSANSINIGRLLPQCLYYIFARHARGQLGRLVRPPCACPAATSATSPPASMRGAGACPSGASSPPQTSTTWCPCTLPAAGSIRGLRADPVQRHGRGQPEQLRAAARRSSAATGRGWRPASRAAR